MTDLLAVQVATGGLALPTPAMMSSLYVSRRAYDEDLRHAFGSDEDLWGQARRDLPRAHVEVDGARVVRPPRGIRAALLCFCTQAVMGMPIEALHLAGALPMEPARGDGDRERRALRVAVDTASGEVVARKRLRLALPEGGVLPICVVVHALDDHVRIDFVGDDARVH